MNKSNSNFNMNNSSNIKNNNVPKQHSGDYRPFNKKKNYNKKQQHKKIVHINNQFNFNDLPSTESTIDIAKNMINQYSLDKPVNMSNVTDDRYTPMPPLIDLNINKSNRASPNVGSEDESNLNKTNYDFISIHESNINPINSINNEVFNIISRSNSQSPNPDHSSNYNLPIFVKIPIKKKCDTVPEKSPETNSETNPEVNQVKEEQDKIEEIIFSEEINDINDLIKLSEKYKIEPNKKYSIDLHKLKNIVEHLKELNEMIGMVDIKIGLAFQLMYFLQGFKYTNMLHTIIEGPPGVGKTCLGKILGKIYLDLKCINTDNISSHDEEEDNDLLFIKKMFSSFKEKPKEEKNKYKFKIAKRSDLVGQYVGHTAVKTQKIINESLGGVLFIDEAYSLGGDDAFSKECINTINQNLSENGDKFICIIAGYADALENDFFSVNSGLHRRFPFRYKIEKYNGVELTQILKKKIVSELYSIDVSFDTKLEKFIEENKDYFPNFGGDIETYFFHVKMMHAKRVFGKSVELRNILNKNDFVNAMNELTKHQKKKEVKLDMYN